MVFYAASADGQPLADLVRDASAQRARARGPGRPWIRFADTLHPRSTWTRLLADFQAASEPAPRQ
jgi:hypothetical protein